VTDFTAGCDCPTIRRHGAQLASSKCSVINDTCIHSLFDANTLLDPVPALWKVCLYVGQSDVYIQWHHNTPTGTCTINDPQLGALSLEWEHLPFVGSPGSPPYLARFKSKEIGEMRDADPRLEVDALVARGVHLETFKLV
jgi:hypothetical protein